MAASTRLDAYAVNVTDGVSAAEAASTTLAEVFQVALGVSAAEAASFTLSDQTVPATALVVSAAEAASLTLSDQTVGVVVLNPATIAIRLLSAPVHVGA